MHGKAEVLQTKSYTGIFDIFGPTPFQNILYRNPHKKYNENIVLPLACQIGDYNKKYDEIDLLLKRQTSYVTSEWFHGLNKQHSVKSVARSASTVFCDLDDIAKRHSMHCLPEVSYSNVNILKVMNLPECTTGFGVKINPIVQECATQIEPKILAKDSLDLKSKSKYPHNDVLSSEIYLRDSNRISKRFRKNLFYNIDGASNRQKIWSYAKYCTEYTKPTPVEKKPKKKGKRTEDPCPCQLFSYACPCTDEKSLTELAQYNKIISATDQITSTILVTQEAKKKKPKNDAPKEDKPTNTATKEKSKNKSDSVIQVATKQDNVINYDKIFQAKNDDGSFRKTPYKVICPKCKEKIEVNITEDEDSSECNFPSGSKEMPPTTAFNCTSSRAGNKNKIDYEDVCCHKPRCELIPVCQILPTEDNFPNPRSTHKHASPKPIPRVIRITKACRHHPPCTVVPSCQRANVLRNNCEFIPPCLHRPRCVNLPLCVPLTKNVYYDELTGKYVDDENKTECHFVPKCTTPYCRQESLTNYKVPYNINAQVQNLCEYNNEYNSPAYVLNPKTIILASTQSPENFCMSNKSCQFNYQLNKVNLLDGQKTVNSDDLIYIRDVGCQFQCRLQQSKDSVFHAKPSLTSSDYGGFKSENYYTNVHTLRYEDKSTIMPSFAEDSITVDSILSTEIDSNCPSHGQGRQQSLFGGFPPKSAFVAAYANLELKPASVEDKQCDVRYRETYRVKSRRSLLKGKCRKIFSVKRKSNAKPSKHSNFISSNFVKTD